MKKLLLILPIAAILNSCGGGVAQQNQTVASENTSQQVSTPKPKKTEQFLTQDLRMPTFLAR
ncbi:MAG: hypothetical protein II937_00415 [Bacteroidales bacterium]|nr:hypothetical protein [Bacteroidales bacterium]